MFHVWSGCLYHPVSFSRGKGGRGGLQLTQENLCLSFHTLAISPISFFFIFLGASFLRVCNGWEPWRRYAPITIFFLPNLRRGQAHAKQHLSHCLRRTTGLHSGIEKCSFWCRTTWHTLPFTSPTTLTAFIIPLKLGLCRNSCWLSGCGLPGRAHMGNQRVMPKNLGPNNHPRKDNFACVARHWLAIAWWEAIELQAGSGKVRAGLPAKPSSCRKLTATPPNAGNPRNPHDSHYHTPIIPRNWRSRERF